MIIGRIIIAAKTRIIATIITTASLILSLITDATAEKLRFSLIEISFNTTLPFTTSKDPARCPSSTPVTNI